MAKRLVGKFEEGPFVLGAGPSGLAIAWELEQRGYDPVLISQDIGGVNGSWQDGDFMFDYGGHVYTTTDKEVVAIMKACDGNLIENRQAFYDARKRIPFPVQDHVNLSPPVDISNPKNLAEYIRSVLGEDFYYKFMRRFNERVWTVPPECMDFDWTAGRIKRPDESDKRWGMNASFWHAPGQDIIAHMFNRLKRTHFIKGRISGIDEAGTLYLASGDFEQIKTSLLDAKFDTIGLFKSRYMTAMENDVLLFGLGFDHKLDIEPFHWLYPGLQYEAHRVTLISRYHEAMAPYNYDSLLVEIPLPSLMNTQPKRLVDFFTKAPEEALSATTGIRIDKAPIATSYRLVRGYPIPFCGHRHFMHETKEYAFIMRNAYLAGRWGSHTYMNLQHILADAKIVVDVSEERSSTQDYSWGNHYYPEKKV